MNPAFYIPLTDEELKMLGEISAILGQIEWFMQLTVMQLLKVSHRQAEKFLGSISMPENVEKWLRVMKRKCPYEEIKPLAEALAKEMKTLGKNRNALIHAFYASDHGGDSFSISRDPKDVQVSAVAVRVRNKEKVPLTSLRATRDNAAKLSHFFFHIQQWTSGVPGTAPNFPPTRKVPPSLGPSPGLPG